MDQGRNVVNALLHHVRSGYHFKQDFWEVTNDQHNSLLLLLMVHITHVYQPGLRIRGIFVRIRIRILQISILKTDPDPDPTYKKSPHFSCPAYFFACFMTKKN